MSKDEASFLVQTAIKAVEQAGFVVLADFRDSSRGNTLERIDRQTVHAVEKPEPFFPEVVDK